SFQQKAKDYDTLEAVLQRHPDLADEIERRLRGEPSTPRAAQAVATLPKEFLQEWKQTREQLGQLTNAWAQQENLRKQAFQQQEMEKTGMELRQRLGGLLKEHNYSDKLYPQAEAYILQRVRELGGADMDDLPYIFNEWYKAMED